MFTSRQRKNQRKLVFLEALQRIPNVMLTLLCTSLLDHCDAVWLNGLCGLLDRLVIPYNWPAKRISRAHPEHMSGVTMEKHKFKVATFTNVAPVFMPTFNETLIIGRKAMKKNCIYSRNGCYWEWEWQTIV